MRDSIRVFRRFNRFYTRLLGLFNKRLLDSPLTLAEARALFEIAASPGVSAAGISQALAMDRGQLSRMVARMCAKGLVRREGEPSGRRPLPLYPTREGLDLLADIEARADEMARQTLRPLGRVGRGELRRALSRVECLLEPGGAATGYVLRQAHCGDLGLIITRHVEQYGHEHDFGPDFGNYVLLGLAEFVNKSPDRSRVWVACSDAGQIGSVGIVERSPDTAQMRWLLVDPAARGLGLGRTLTEHALNFCREKGYRKINLWTIKQLHAAKSLYASAGFGMTETKQGAMGGVPVTEECWTLDLASK